MSDTKLEAAKQDLAKKLRAEGSRGSTKNLRPTEECKKPSGYIPTVL